MLIEFLVVAIFIYYLARMVFRLVLPMLFQGIVNKAAHQNQQQYRQSRPQDSNRIKVDYAPKTKNAIPDSEGDFIDYEEIR